MILKRLNIKESHQPSFSAGLTGVLIFLAAASITIPLVFAVEQPDSLSSPQWIGIYQEQRGVNLRWFRVQRAVEYAVLRKDGDQGAFREIGRVKNPVFDDLTIKEGQNYYYQVIPYGEKSVMGKPSETRYLRVAARVPEILPAPEWSISHIRKDGIAMTWSHPITTSVLAYNLYRKRRTDKEYVLIHSTLDTNYLDANVTPGSKYQYVITALNKNLKESSFSEILEVNYQLPTDAGVGPDPYQEIKTLEEVVNHTDLIRIYGWEEYGFVSPIDVEYRDQDGQIYISDSGTGQIVIIGKSGDVLDRLGGTGSARWEFERLLGIALDSYGNLYAVDAYRGEVVVFNSRGEFERRVRLFNKLVNYFGDEFTSRFPNFRFGLVDLAVTIDGTMLIIDDANSLIYVLDKRDRLVNVIGGKGEEPGLLHYPTFLKVTDKGDFVVSDTLNSRLQFFGDKGDPGEVIGEPGLGIGQFVRPKGISFDSDGFLYVADSYLNVIQVFHRNGDLVALLGDENGLPLDLGSPNGVLFVEPEQLFICEKLARRVQVRKVSLRSDLPFFVNGGGQATSGQTKAR